MTKRWIGLAPCVSIVILLAVSCGSSDGGQAGGSAGLGGHAGLAEGGNAGTSGGGDAGADHSAGAAGAPETDGQAGSAGADIAEGGAGGAGGSAGGPDDSLSPDAIPDLAFWMDGRSPSYSDLDENYPTPLDSGRIRSIAEASPLTGHWQAATSDERPVRERGAVSLKPIETSTGYNLRNATGTIHTDGSTLAISFRPLWGEGSPAQGGLLGPIGSSAQSMGLFFIGNSIGLSFNHTGSFLTRHIPRGAHVTLLVRFTADGAEVQFDIDGFRATETIAATVAHETATNFNLGYDPANNADMYGFVSQVVGIDRAVSDDEASHLMDWLANQRIPDAFAVDRPLIAIIGDSISNGDQVPAWQRWGFGLLADLSNTNPDLQLLNASLSGAGIPTVKNSPYSDTVLPWYSAKRAKNVLIVAAGSNDLAGGNNLQDMLDRYYGLLDSARATGWKTVACTVLPRSDATLALGKNGFEAERAAFNGDIVAHWAAHADALADVAAIPVVGAPTGSDNATYYGADKIHPTAAGNALLKPVYRTAVASLL